MAERLIIATVDPGHVATVTAIAEQKDVLSCTVIPTAEEAADEARQQAVHLVVEGEKRQGVLDALQQVLAGSDNWRVTILRVEATLPDADKAAAAGEKASGGKGRKAKTGSREELYADIGRRARPDRTFVMFVVLSTIVAAIGLIENNIAVVIGAMVIAPFLGPILAFSLGVVLGDGRLMWRALLTNLVGVAVTLAICIAIGLIWPLDLTSQELLSRTDVGYAGIALALASGAAATVSLTTGLSSALVGVMVAVALLPPAATIGLMLGAGEWTYAWGAALLLAVNVVSVNLAAQVAFAVQGVTPRTRLEKTAARRAVILSIAFWLAVLAAIAVLLYLRRAA